MLSTFPLVRHIALSVLMVCIGTTTAWRTVPSCSHVRCARLVNSRMLHLMAAKCVRQERTAQTVVPALRVTVATLRIRRQPDVSRASEPTVPMAVAVSSAARGSSQTSSFERQPVWIATLHQTAKTYIVLPGWSVLCVLQGVRSMPIIRHAQSARRVSSARTVLCAQSVQQVHSHVCVRTAGQMVATHVYWSESRCTAKTASAVKRVLWGWNPQQTAWHAALVQTRAMRTTVGRIQGVLA